MSTNLTKKQQKALAFRQRSKKKPQPEDVPEQDVIEEDQTISQGVSKVASSSTTNSNDESSKKRKRTEDKAGDDEGEGKMDLSDGIKGKLKDVGKGKGKWDENEAEGEITKKSKKETKQRFILFVGNLGFKTTQPDIQYHFKQAIGEIPQVRLLTTKPTRPSDPPKSRGIAFLELRDSTAMQSCLKLHHSQLGGRRINVELTAGGGGKSEGRVKKLKERQERVGVQRVKREEREKENAGVEGEGGEKAIEGQQDKAMGGQGKSSGGAEEMGDGSVKMRGGRRVKVKSDRPSGPSNTAAPGNSQLPGWNNRQSAVRQPSNKGRKRWEPTGANAVMVG